MNLLQVIKVRRIRDNYYTSDNTIRETMAERKREGTSNESKGRKKIAKKTKIHHVSFSIASFSNFFFIALTTKEPVRTTDFIAKHKKREQNISKGLARDAPSREICPVDIHPSGKAPTIYWSANESRYVRIREDLLTF